MPLYFHRAAYEAWKSQRDALLDDFPYNATKQEMEKWMFEHAYEEKLARLEFSREKEEPLLGDEERKPHPIYIHFENGIQRLVTTDVDGTITNPQALMRLLKKLSEYQQVDLGAGLKEYGKRRAEYSELLHAEKKDPAKIFKQLRRVEQGLRKPLSASINGMPMESAVEIAAEFGMDLYRNNLFDPGLFKFAETMHFLRYKLLALTQNFDFFYALPLGAAGFDAVIGNKIPKVRDGKIIFEDKDDGRMRVMTSADKGIMILNKGIRYIADLLHLENLSRSDMTKDEQEGFREVFDKLSYPRIGLSMPYFIESKDENKPGGDYELFAKMPGVASRFDRGFLRSENEFESEVVGGLPTDKFLDLVELSNILLSRNYWLRGVHVSNTADEHLRNFESALQGKNNFKNSQETSVYTSFAKMGKPAEKVLHEEKAELERRKVKAERLDALAVQQGLKPVAGKIVFEKEEDIVTYRISGIPARVDELEIKHTMLHTPRQYLTAHGKAMEKFFGDVQGSVECLDALAKHLGGLSLERKREFVLNMKK